MKAKLLILIKFLFFSVFTISLCYGQRDSLINKYELSAIKDSVSLKKKGYYVLKINDLRINRKNLGSIALKSGKVPIVISDSLPDFLIKAFRGNLSPEAELEGLIINIEKLKSFASSNGKTDEAEMYIKVNFQNSDSEPKNIHSFEKTFSYKKKSQPDFLSEFICYILKSSTAGIPDGIASRQLTETANHNSSYISETENLENSYILKNFSDTISLKEKGYFLQLVQDQRFIKKNIGSVNLKTGKQAVIVPDSLPAFLSKAFNQNPDSGLKPFTIRIEKFKTLASTAMNIDEAQLYMKLTAHTTSGQAIIQINSFEKTFSYKKRSMPDFLTQFIFSSFNTAVASILSETKTVNYGNSGVKNSKNIAASKKINYTIPLFEKSDAGISGLRINAIQDQRPDGPEVGNVYVGYFNRNANAILDSGLSIYISKLIRSDSLENSKSATLVINKLDCNEYLTNNGEKATFSLQAQIMTDSLDTKYVLYQGKVETDTTTDGDVTDLWPKIIASGLSKLFLSFKQIQVKPVRVDSIKAVMTKGIITEQLLAKHYYYNNEEVPTIGSFKNIFSKTSDDTLKKMYKNSKTMVRTGRVLIATGLGMFLYPVADYINNEEKSIKKWYNDENASTKSTLLVEKKTIVPLSLGVLATGFVIKWIGKNLLTQSISRYNRSIIENVSFDINPNLNGYEYSFRLGVLLSQSR